MRKDRKFNVSLINKPDLRVNQDNGEEYWFWDNRVNPQNLTWNELLELLSKHEQVNDKEDAWLFSPTEHFSPDTTGIETVNLGGSRLTRKCSATAKAISLIVLDVESDDDSGSIDNFILNNHDFEYLLVSSFNHKTEKYNFKDRYRVYIPISSSLSIAEYKALRASLINRFPYVDTTCFDVARAFFLPSCSPTAINDAVVHRNKSDAWFDISTLEPEVDAQVSNKKSAYVEGNEKFDFHLTTFRIVDFFQDKGLYIKTLKGDKHAVTCPNNHNHTASSQIDSTVIYNSPGFNCQHAHCSINKSGIKWLVDFYGAEEISKYCQPKVTQLAPDIPTDTPFVTPCYDRIKNDISEAVSDVLHQHKNTGTGNSYCLYAAEGTTKSESALHFFKLGKTVIFLTKSYKQANAKAVDFKKLGIDVVVVKSRDAQFRENTNCSIIRKNANHPFKVGGVNLKATIQKTAGKIDQTERLLEYHIIHCLDDDSIQKHLSKNKKFIITTFAQMRKLCATDFELPENVVVFFDDPDFSDIIHLAPYDDKTHKIPKNRRNYESAEGVVSSGFSMESINGKQYFTRPKGMAPNQSKCLIVYTTTEICIKNYLESIDVHVFDLMERLDAGKITILGTNAVHRKRDALLAIISSRLNKEDRNIAFIANAVGSELNHTNSKGLNSLSDRNIVVKISQPPEIVVETYIAALNLPNVNKNSLEWRNTVFSLMFDMMNQSIGRAAGYRYKDCEVVVLADPQYHKGLVKYSRYALEQEQSVLIDGLVRSSNSRIPEGASDLVKQLNYYINSKEYPCSPEYSLDKKSTVDAMIDANKRPFLTRLALAEEITKKSTAGISEFIKHGCIAEGDIKLVDFKKPLKQWQKNNGRLQLKDRVLREELQKLGYDVDNNNRNKTYYIVGLSLNAVDIAA